MISGKILPSVVLRLAAIIRSSLAVSHAVGGSNGRWELGTDLQTWASTKVFAEGDELDFQYSPGHDVSEVTKEDYDSCRPSSPIQTFTGGSTVIPLSSPGKRYFICSVPGHCAAGMKLEINTLMIAAAPVSISTPPTIAPAPSAQPTPWTLSPFGSPSSPLFADPNHLSEHSANSSGMKHNAAGILSFFLVIILRM